MKSRMLLAGIALWLASISLAPGEPATGPAPDLAAMEKQFTQLMSGARMSGYFTIEGQQGPPQQDQYTLGKVEKREGDKWLFSARIEYGKRVITLPLEIPVLWAGDTPVITVSNLTMPGLGTYTARVMIHGNHYAGTWSSPDHSGYLWGRIEHVPGGNKAPADAPPEK